MKDKYKYAISGAAAGAANGLFGAGGGMVLVPLLTRWAKIDDKEAFATSICIIAPLCIVSIIVYCLNGTLAFGESIPYLIGGFIGGIIGGKLFRKIPASLLHRILGIIIIYGGIRQLL